MFSMCESMKWSHLPVAGGLYDQHPALLDAFAIIFSERSKYEAAEHAKRERQMRTRNPSRVAGRR